MEATQPRIIIPYEDKDNSPFNCVGVHNNRQFLAFISGAAPIDPQTGHPEWLNESDPEWKKKKRWYGILFWFDMEGEIQEIQTVLGGTEEDGMEISMQRAFEALNHIILGMEGLEMKSITVQPFREEIDGYLFALLPVKTDMGNLFVLYPNRAFFHPPFQGQYSF